ncbi:hypothetical protein Q7P37_001945 [Cladosporium fusiforme]
MNASTTPSPDGIMDSAAFYFHQTRPMLPLYVHLIVSALFPIITGSFASLTRPSTAAKPSKGARKGDGEEHDDDEEGEEEPEQKMEGLSPKDAIVLPITAGAVLGGLYWLIKQYGADPINLILGWYFSGVGIFSVGKILNDAAALALSVLFPTYFAHKGRLWRIDGRECRAVSTTAPQEARGSPLPGVLGLLPLPGAVASGLWSLRNIPGQKYALVAYIKGILEVDGPITLLNVAAAASSVAAIGYNHFIDKPWWLTNLQGFAVSYTALQVMSPTTFATGSLILSGLFFYDIWAVFFTPLMVTVAKNLDQPIKLLFPRPDEPAAAGKPAVKSFSMLGLGDIVLPGLMIGLALRFDLHMYYLKKQRTAAKVDKDGKAGEEVIKADYHNVTGHWGSRIWTWGLGSSSLPASLQTAAFPKPYFIASLVGYVAGMIATLAVMSIWQHAQPALLYLVPGVLISIWTTGLVRGELKQMWSYTEAVSGEAAEEDEGSDSKKKDEKKEEQKSPESWPDYLKYEVIGLSRPSDVSEKKSEDGKKSDKKDEKDIEAKAAKDPDSIFAFTIRRIRTSSSKRKADKEASSQHDDATSRSSSEDAVIVSKDDDQASSAQGPARRTRSKKA